MTVLDVGYREQDVRCLKMVYAAMNLLILDLRGEGVTKQRSAEEMKVSRRNSQREAGYFIQDKSEAPYSFLWMCDRLGADPWFIINAYKNGSILEWQPQESRDMGITFLLKRA